jgi:hypothetical protein
MIYVYPIDFESKLTNRRVLIQYAIIGIALFQFGMFTIIASASTRRVAIYIFALFIIEVMVVFTTFEFIRKPWEGEELEIEKVM